MFQPTLLERLLFWILSCIAALGFAVATIGLTHENEYGSKDLVHLIDPGIYTSATSLIITLVLVVRVGTRSNEK